jgi:hypothetical protein
MKAKWFHLWFLVVLALSAHAADVRTVSGSWPAPASIRYVDSRPNKDGARGFRFRVTNTSKTPLFFDGYSASSPLYRVQFHRLGLFWRPLENQWRSTGVETHSLPPGRSFTFWVRDPVTVWPWAAGIPFRRHPTDRKGEFTIWGDTFK